MADIDYKRLYSIQDRVLDIVFTAEQEFYLTGGTCLSRFYQLKRYSDDLDFFTNNSSRYGFALKNIKRALLQELKVDIEIESKAFSRLKVEDELQLDFINDISPRYKDVVVVNNYLIDNVENILILLSSILSNYSITPAEA